MSAKLERLCQKLREVFGDRIGEPAISYGEVTVMVLAANYRDVAVTLRDHPELRFEQLTDLSGIDYSTAAGRAGGPRFAAVSHLLSVTHNWRLRLRVYATDDASPTLPTMTGVWRGANWYEREAYDMYGIVFEGHPDLRRILTDYGFVGHPFRKDFPISGYVEMRYDPEQQRVVYQPVTIEPREVTPRIVREAHYGKAGGRG
ncbi:MAG: NADH-quinone oxidoreductase subunit C [Rhodocyclales bacterium]|jgi:NADH-quinone oxidoreductase subunit C|nr:NADH-quinone oxidoreductase subunit C [Rhodocyclales bacterium]